MINMTMVITPNNFSKFSGSFVPTPFYVSVKKRAQNKKYRPMTKGLVDGTTFYFTCPAVTGLPVPIFTSENALTDEMACC